MNVGVVKFQRLYRQYLSRKQEERLKIKLQREKHHHENISRQRDFRESLNKNLITLEHVPANKVKEYFLETQNVSAIKIQSAFRGMQARRQIEVLRREKVFHDAACVIQRQVNMTRCLTQQSSVLFDRMYAASMYSFTLNEMFLKVVLSCNHAIHVIIMHSNKLDIIFDILKKIEYLPDYVISNEML